MEKERINVVFFLPSLEGGGAERNTINIITHINKKEYQASLLLAERQGDFLQDISGDILISDLGVGRRAYLNIFLALIKYFKKERPDIFVSSFPHINIMSLVARKIAKSKTKIIITEHVGLLSLPEISGSFINSLVSRFLLPMTVRLVYPLADAIVCVSEGVKKDLVKITHNRLKFKVIYNPIDDAQIEKSTKEEASHPWFLQKVPILVMAGRLIPLKDYYTAFLALNIISEKMDVRLMVLGRGPEKQKLKELSVNLGLAENVAFLGFQKNPYKYISKSSVFVLSSTVEGFGNVIVEAMTCGIPVVATDCQSGPGEIITDHKNGLLVPVKNPQMLADAILQVLTNPGLRNSLVLAGKKRALDFSIKIIIQQYQNVFTSV